ncbi:hypothetical protein SCHPADRAFT_226125 [Schizopora paradoxa]|uniref:Uncharacterized protein n=1 Tax=Schizopora paradoxa TaxID=27342 RepID=A0A0H2RX62_9AGAM|nr:hypothetical protein SCHPADRAFT_226125 [Schizopora paradoxa]
MWAFRACIFRTMEVRASKPVVLERLGPHPVCLYNIPSLRQEVSSSQLLRRISPQLFASAARSTNTYEFLTDQQRQLFHSFNTTPHASFNMKLTKMASLSNLISNIRGSEPALPSARGRGNFDNKVVDIAPCKTPKENINPSTPTIRIYRTPLVQSLPQNDTKDHGNFLDLTPNTGKSPSFFRLPSPRPRSRKDEPIRPEHISRPRPSPHDTTPSFKVPAQVPTPSSAHSRRDARTPSDDYFAHKSSGRVERYGEHPVPYAQPPSQSQSSSRRNQQPRTPQLTSHKSTPALSAHHRNHRRLPSNKNPRPDVPADALDYEEDFEAELAESNFHPATSKWDDVYYFKDLPGREAELKPLMLIERMGSKDSSPPRYSFDNVSLSANHGIESSKYCF